MRTVAVPAGELDCDDTGAGPPVVLLHGLLMDHTVWNQVLPLLPTGFRYLRPVLPLGAHRRPMHRDADLTLAGQVSMVADLLEALDLEDVTLVHSDWAGRSSSPRTAATNAWPARSSCPARHSTTSRLGFRARWCHSQPPSPVASGWQRGSCASAGCDDCRCSSARWHADRSRTSWSAAGRSQFCANAAYDATCSPTAVPPSTRLPSSATPRHCRSLRARHSCFGHLTTR
jgi:hypothetical protein